MNRIRCFLLPAECDGVAIAPQAVVIDVLRASTTISTALSNGARSIHPFSEVDLVEKFKSDSSFEVLTGGERGGEKLPGFDLGNSPLEYSTERVGDRTIAFTTTNGTRAMEKCRSAQEVVIGAFCNRTAVAEYFRSFNELDVICAGTDGEVSVEDCAFAGSLLDYFSTNHEIPLGGNEKYCLKCWREFQQDSAVFLRSGAGGQNLERLGRGEDIDFAAQLDTLEVVPRLKIDEWKIEPA